MICLNYTHRKKTRNIMGLEQDIHYQIPWLQIMWLVWQSDRDVGIFKLLTEDIESGRNKYVSISALKELYTKMTGKNSNVHKYHVIKWDEPSNLIPAHLYKDGLKHIHPDSSQCRTLTVRRGR